jgi:uncharacterized membrane protein
MFLTLKEISCLPTQNGFRLRGHTMTRLETFVDAAFAFAITMLVISLGRIPGSYNELILALKAAPTFIFSFASYMLFWIGHRKWSRRYGLEDSYSILLSLILVFVMLVFVYPLRLMSSAFFAWVSNGFFPADFTLATTNEFIGLIMVYGIGWFFLSMVIALHFIRASTLADKLHLNAVERIRTRAEIASWLAMAATALISFVFAWIAAPKGGVWSMFFYSTLGFSMPYISIAYGKKLEKLPPDPIKVSQ